MGLFETLAAPSTATNTEQAQEQQYSDPPDGWTNPHRCPRELSGMAQRDKWGRVIASMSGKPLPPNVIATGYVRNPATNGYQLIEQASIPITHEVASMLEVAAQEYAVKLAAQTAVAPPAPAYAPPAPPTAPQAPAPAFAGFAPPGMQPPPAAPSLPQVQPPAPQWRQGPAINPPEASAHPAAPPAAPQYAPPPAPVAPTAPQTDDKPKRRAGRPTNAERAARAAGAQGQAPAPVGTVATPAVTSPEDVNRDRGFSIFLDCAPVVGFDADNYDLSDIVEMVRPAFRDNHQVEDYALVDFKGPALLAHYVEGKLRELLKDGDVNLTIHSHTREAHACLGRLIPLAGTVVRGL